MSLFSFFRRFVFILLLPLAATPACLHAAGAPAPDTLVLSNGDILHGSWWRRRGGR